MPELPEVETIVRQIYDSVCGLRVISVQIQRPDYLKNYVAQTLIDNLNRQILQNVTRRGKFIIMNFNSGTLVTHLGMTGNYQSFDASELQLASTKHLIFQIEFSDRWLRLTDIRRFGKLLFFDEFTPWENSSEFKRLGIEPLSDSFSTDYLFSSCQKTAIPIKSLLLDQSIIAGIGNIYANEALFMSKINPHTPANQLTSPLIDQLTATLKNVLEKAIEFNGTSFSDFLNLKGHKGGFQDFLRVYGKKGTPCPTCHKTIKQELIGGRSSFYCPNCQPLG